MDSLKRSSDNYKEMDEVSGDRDSSFCSVFEHIQVGMAIVDVEGICFKVNSKLCEISGYPESELLGSGFKKLIYPKESEHDLVLTNKIPQESSRLHNEEKACLQKDGVAIWVIVSKSLAVDYENRPLYFVFQIEDITRRKKAELALEDSEKKFEVIFENASDVITINEPGGRLLEVNRITCEKLGYSREEMLQKNGNRTDSLRVFKTICRAS